MDKLLLLFMILFAAFVFSKTTESFMDSQKDSKKWCSQESINEAYREYVFGESTKTKI